MSVISQLKGDLHMRRIEYIGLLLVGLSAYPLLLMTREIFTGRAAYGRYKMVRIRTDAPGFADDALSTRVGPHIINLRDALWGQPAKPEDRAKTTVGIVVDGHDYSFDGEIEVRPFYRDQNRYHSWVNMNRLVDKEAGTEQVAVVQRISPPPASGRAAWDFPKRQLRYRILLIAEDGHVSEEIFSFEDRAQPAYRTMLGRYVTPFGIGFHSQVLQVWPSIIYPIFYPWATAVAGCCLLGIGLIGRLLNVRKAVT